MVAVVGVGIFSCCRAGAGVFAAGALRSPSTTRPLRHRGRASYCSTSPIAVTLSSSKAAYRAHLQGRAASSVSTSSAAAPSPSTSMEAPPPGYRRNVGICLVDPTKTKIFSASRLDVPGAWQMPQGGVDEGEDPRNAAVRELREETGVTSAEIIAEAPYWLTYDFPPEVREKLNRQWGSDWKGQAQKWFLFRLTGREEEINLLGDGSEKPEFGEWSWMSPAQVIEHAVEFKKPVYEEVLKVFAPHLQ